MDRCKSGSLPALRTGLAERLLSRGSSFSEVETAGSGRHNRLYSNTDYSQV